MLTRRVLRITAMSIMAVMLIGIGLSGCATKRDVSEIKAEVRTAQRQNQAVQETLDRLDSVLVASVDADRKLRTDISVTVDELQLQMDQLMANYNDLMALVQQLSTQPQVIHRIQSSPGAQEQSSVTIADTGTAVEETPPPPSIDCGATYDESFIKVRRGDYEEAIAGFRAFLQECPDHQNVENAYYWIGECYYSLEKYVDAITEFEYLINNYKGSVNSSRAMYKLARSKQELGKNKEAKTIFEKLIDEYPETLEASQAKERLKDMQ